MQKKTCSNLNYSMLILQKVNTDQTCSCVWQLKSNIPEFPSLDLKFTMDYCCQSGQDQIKRSLPYTFSFTDYQVLLNYKSNIPEFPPLDLKFTMDYCCQSGQDQIKRSLPYTFSFTDYQVLLNYKSNIPEFPP